MNENCIEYIKHIAYELGEFATAKKGLNKNLIVEKVFNWLIFIPMDVSYDTTGCVILVAC